MALLVGDLFRRGARSVSARVAASLGDAELSYGDLDRRANRLANALRGLGLARGDRVLWWGDTSLDAVVLFAALAKLGAVFAPINARFGAKEAEPVAGMARARLLVADGAHVEAAESVAKTAGTHQFARLGGGAGPGLDLDALAERAAPDDPHEPGLAETDPQVIFFTSGSTGRPKGVVLSHRANWLRSFQGTFLAAPDREVCMFPLFHMAGWTIALRAWQARGEVAFVSSPSAEALLSAVERRHATRLYCIPAVWSRILATQPDAFDTRSLREIDTGTSATPPELIAALKERFPATRTRIFYGSTEAGAATALSDEDVLRKPGSVGPPAPGVDLCLSEQSEVCVRTDFLMDGYFDDPEASAAALRDGWYHTGDLGALDDEGYLYIVGRLRDTIRTGGETVSPAEVEAVLTDHSGIAEVAVVGLPDAQWGELVCAVVVPRPGARFELGDLTAHCAGRLARFKQPRRLECVDELPRTAATGQVQRAMLIERLASR